MTQSFTLREPDSDLAQAAVFTSPNMMPPWKQQSDVAFNLLQGDAGVVMLEKPGQKRRRSFMPTGPDQLNLYNDTNLPHERVSNDSVQLSGVEPYPASTGDNIFGTTGLDSAQSFPSERRGFYSRILDSSSCGIFPFRAPEVVEHGVVDPRTAHNNSSVFLQGGRNNNNNADAFGSHNQYYYRNHHRALDSAAVATAQAMANFQAIIDQSRSSSGLGFQAYNNHGSSTGTSISTLPNPSPIVPQYRQAPSFTPPGVQQQLHSISGLSNSSFEEPTPTSSGFNYFNVGSSGNNQSSFLEDINSSASLAFGDAAPAGVDGIYGASLETTWPNLTCRTTTVPCNANQSTTPLADPPTSPCTPRGHHRRSITTVLSDSQEEYLQHMERINSEALMLADTPHHSSRGRRLSYFDPLPSSAERSSRGNTTSVFHPFELGNLGSNNPQQAAKHLHVYFDESGVPQRVHVEGSAHVGGEDSACATTTQVDESAGGPCGAPGEETQEENFSESFESAAAMAGGKDNRRNNNNNNTADQFDLNEVPVGVGEATPPKPRKKYHPRVAKDKRTYKRRVDGKKVPASPADGFTHMNSPAKRSGKKRSNQYDSTHEEGRESSYPEVVDMDIEDTVGVTPPTATQHDTAVCDCEACIKLRLERRNSTATGHNSTEPRFTCLDDDMPQSPVSPPERRHSRGDPWGTVSVDSPSDSPSVRRTLFQQASAPPAPPASELDQASIGSTRRLSLAFDDSSPDVQPSNAMVLSQSNATAYRNVRAFFNSHRQQSSCLQQFNESTTQLGLNWNGRQQVHGCQSDGAAIVAAKPAFDWNPAPFHRTAATNSTFMNRLCPRGILSPQKIPFRNMNAIQRVVYLKSILNSNHQLTTSPESLLRHVYDHLPEDEKEQFRSSLWPIILKPLTEEQMKQLEDYASAEPVVGAPSMAMAVVKRKPGPKPKNKASKKELAMTLWPDLVTQDGSHKATTKPAKGEKPGRKSKINNSVVDPSGVVDAQNGLEMVPYETNHIDNNTQSMVPYENKSVVPYEGPFNPLRKRKPRPKVVLDHETVRVWKLLMGKTTSTSAENVTDAENELKWVEERRKMKAQALLFIERMHIVQGDRSFSCWKGSVVDSVVGAFLTQNVNDVLSSSAFMSMRSRFPGRGFRRPTKGDHPDEETVAQSCESPSSPAPSPPIQNPQTNNDALQEPSTTDAPEFPPTSSVVTTVLESQESRNEGENYDHLLMQQPAATTQEPPGCQNHEESASNLSEVINQQPEDVVLSQSGLSEQSQTTVRAKASNSQSENSSSGLEYQTVPEESSSAGANNGVANGHPVDPTETQELSTEGSAALTVEGNGHEPSHGKFNPKTGLTGLERAKIEEKQVTARKSFDFSGLQEEFKPRLVGEQRPPAPPRTELTQDGVDWEAVRSANVQEVADVIKERGLNWILAGRIKAFLERIHLHYGTLDLEWLRSMSTDQTKEFLLSIRGLGLKSVECIRLLTLHHLAFPVDTNVGRICVRLGWVPLEPLPEELQLHLLELYPVQATIQKYLWPRLCKLDQQTLYELHYQMITFGKVFCTKSKPNCNACPMRPECKHFASALSGAKLALPASERPNNGPTLALPPGTTTTTPGSEQKTDVPSPHDRVLEPPRPVSQYCQPIVEEPMTPESEADMEEYDIEDYPFTVEEVDDDTDMNICIQDGIQDGIQDRIQDQPSVANLPLAPTQLVHQSHSIDNLNCSSILNVTISEPDPVSEPLPEVAVSEPLVPESATIMEDWGGLATSTTTGAAGSEEVGVRSVIDIVESVCEEVGDVESNVGNASEVLIHPSHEMVLVAPGAASLPVPKLKNVGRLRTVHYVYELPDNHPLLDGLDPREGDDPCTYLLAIWSPGEVPESIPNMNDTVHEENPFASSNAEGEESIKATLLVPCRTAMQGSFPLNGTYFQVNEVFADHVSSLQPMIVPRTLLWNLRRRFVFFGTSVTSIFRGMTVEEIQACFWRGYVCVRGFDRATRAPKPLVGRLHLQAGKGAGKNME